MELTKAEKARKNREDFIKYVGEGYTVERAAKIIGVSVATYEYYMREHPDFKQAVTDARATYNSFMARRSTGGQSTTEVPDFPEFCKEYLGMELSWHQLQWFDMLEGREPRDLHPAMVYQKPDFEDDDDEDEQIYSDRNAIVNTPPNHAKSTTITMAYVVWRIIKNLNISIIILSKNEKSARKFILQIKERLTAPRYEKLWKTFAPFSEKGNGFKDGAASWRADAFYVGGRDAEGKDPTVQALGLGGQVYGARADLIICDDIVDKDNAHRYDEHIDFINSELLTRLNLIDGTMLIVGTRISAKDLYSEIRNPKYYADEQQPWTYLLQPAVLEYADDPKDWTVLWPESNIPITPNQQPKANGKYTARDGKSLNRIRRKMSAANWARMYQQEQVSEDNIFKAEAIDRCIEMRHAGIIPNDVRTGREGGMQGLRVIGGLDPAMGGHSAFIAYGVDLNDGHRYVIDVYNKANMMPEEIHNMIKMWSEKYNIKEWRIERNGLQTFLTRDANLNQWLSSRGIMLVEHMTNNNKHDEDFGVAAMSSLFENGLIHLPNKSNESVKALIEQLITWQPKTNKKHKTDTVMALWFAELRALEMVTRVTANKTFRDTAFTTKGDKFSRHIISANDADFGTPLHSWWGN